jgi:hypothetical protein
MPLSIHKLGRNGTRWLPTIRSEVVPSCYGRLCISMQKRSGPSETIMNAAACFVAMGVMACGGTEEMSRLDGGNLRDAAGLSDANMLTDTGTAPSSDGALLSDVSVTACFPDGSAANAAAPIGCLRLRGTGCFRGLPLVPSPSKRRASRALVAFALPTTSKAA